MTRVAVNGAAGRMGRALVQALAEANDLDLGAAYVRPGSSLTGTDAGELAGVGALGVMLGSGPPTGSDSFDILIDFTRPEATLEWLGLCEARGKGMIIGTTGFDARGLAAIRRAAERIPVLFAPNMSVGVNLAFKLAEVAARVLGHSADVEIMEAHHRHKIDAPSGTALELGRIIAGVLGRELDQVAVYGREGRTGARSRDTIGFATVRAGDIVGEHTVLFACTGERLEITHRAQSRRNFAEGALRAVRFLSGRPHGLFDMQDVLGIGGKLG